MLADERLPPGCFMVNTMVELGGGIESVDRRTDTYRASLLRSIQAALTRAATAQEIPADTVEHRARVTQSALFGVLGSARSSSVPDTVEGIEALTVEVRSWHRGEPRPP